MRVDDPLHEVQAESVALNLMGDRMTPSIERLEDVRTIVGRNAGPAVRNGYLDRPSTELRATAARAANGASHACRHAHPARVAAIFHRVANQVLHRRT